MHNTVQYNNRIVVMIQACLQIMNFTVTWYPIQVVQPVIWKICVRINCDSRLLFLWYKQKNKKKRYYWLL